MLPAYQSARKFGDQALKGRPPSTQDPFQLAIQSAQRLQGFGATPMQARSTVTMPQIRDAGSPVSPVSPPFVSGSPKPTPPSGGYDYSGINPGGLYDPSRTEPPSFISGAQSATKPPALPSPTRPAPSEPVFSHYDANGKPIYSQEERTRAVGPGPVGSDVYAARAAELNNASSRWHGNINENDVRAFDQYAASYRERGGVGTPEIWDWLAAGRPQTKGDYYDDKAVEYNFHARTKGLYYGVITRDDVVALHRFNESQAAAGKPGMEPVEWLTAGKPATAWDGVTRPGMPNMGGAWRNPADLAVGSGGGVRGGPPPPPAPPPTPPVPGASSAPAPPAAQPPNAAPPPAAPTPPLTGDAPPTTPSAAPQLGNFNDTLERTIAEVEKRYDPSHQRARDDLQRRLIHTGSITGAISSGGFPDVVGDRMVDLFSEQQAQLGEEISKQTINATQLAMQKYVAELNDSFSRLQLQTNSDLEAKAQELQKYGIDKEFFMAKYKADLASKDIQYSANAQVNAASMQAAASQAAAAAQLEAARYNADRDYQLGLVNADVMREGNILDVYTAIAGMGAEWLEWIMKSDPLNIFGGGVPGDVVIKP